LEQKLNGYLDQLEKCAPRSAAINKELSRLGWYAPESNAQAQLIEKTFGDMMISGSEGEHGIGQFQKKVKNFSWREFWGSQNPSEGLDFGRSKM
jgi:hydroxymethylglutaryl-CoA lyase